MSKKTLVPSALQQQVSVRVTNTGKREGVEVVQLYVRDDVATLTRPVRQLRGFQRVAQAPGESKTVTFDLGFEDLAMYDDRMQQVVEPGTFTVYVGGSSDRTREVAFEVTAQQRHALRSACILLQRKILADTFECPQVHEFVTF